jgi:multisubunit Na+/H+ antiporter MnhB subunit
MRLPGAVMLITIGMLVLWLAITGKLDRFATAWGYVKGEGELPEGGGTSIVKPAAFNPLDVLVDRDVLHTLVMADAIKPASMRVPGGVLA